MQNDPRYGNASINKSTLPSNIDPAQEEKQTSEEGSEAGREGMNEPKPEDFEKFDVDKVEELENSKDPSQKEES